VENSANTTACQLSTILESVSSCDFLLVSVCLLRKLVRNVRIRKKIKMKEKIFSFVVFLGQIDPLD